MEYNENGSSLRQTMKTLHLAKFEDGAAPRRISGDCNCRFDDNLLMMYFCLRGQHVAQ